MDYSKVIMVGNKYATRNEKGELTLFDTKEEASGKKQEPKLKPKKKQKK